MPRTDKTMKKTDAETVTFSYHEQKFIEYADSFIGHAQEPCLILKKEHTFRVVENTKKILSSLFLAPQDRYCAELTALYHDIGRFTQYETYKTFLDKKSENHAHLAVRILKKYEPFLREPKHIQEKVLAAVMLHNALQLPAKLPEKFRLLCEIIRDADKLDIMYVMAMNFTQSLPEKDSVILHVKDDPYAFSKHILALALQGRVIKYTDLVYVNDFKILLCAWIFSLYLPKSKELLKEQGFINIILDSLPNHADIAVFKEMILKELNYGSCTECR